MERENRVKSLIKRFFLSSSASAEFHVLWNSLKIESFLQLSARLETLVGLRKIIYLDFIP